MRRQLLNLRYLSVSRLKPWAGNPRDNAEAVDAVAGSIRAFGFNAPILCDQKLNVVAGHTRLAAAKKLKMRRVPVDCLRDFNA
jgi:site-specific DNA-methyltransferase (adenine-specific)